MLAKQVQVQATELLTHLDSLKSRNTFDKDVLELRKGDMGKPAHNPVRPVGPIVTARFHYMFGIVDNATDQGLPPIIRCVGRPDCPICAVADELKNVGTTEAKEQARQYYNTERNYWNALPRWDYDFEDGKPRFLALCFGTQARQTLTEIVTDFGHPGDPERGYDLDLIIEAKPTFGSDYQFRPVMTKTQDSEGITQRVKKSPLDGEELEFPLIDLEKFIADPTPDEFEKLQAIFNRDERDPESREDFSTDDSASSELPPELQNFPAEDKSEEEIDEREEVDASGRKLCFGDVDYHAPDNAVCEVCELFDDCANTVALKKQRADRRRDKGIE